MTVSSDARHLELSVTNFGPISDGRIELRPLTVFVGPSNTGKSYFASLIYTLQRFFSSHFGQTDAYQALPKEFWSEATRDSWGRGGSLSESNVAVLVKWTADFLAQNRAPKDDASRKYIELPEKVAKLVRPLLNDATAFSTPLENEFARCFGVDQTGVLRNYFGGESTLILLKGTLPTEKGKSHPFFYKVNVRDRGVNLESSFPTTTALQFEHSFFEENVKPQWLSSVAWTRDEGIRIFGAFKLLNLLSESFASSVLSPISLPSYFLPAGRAGVMHSHQVVVRSLIASASRPASQHETPLPVLSGVLGDFLDQLVALSGVSHLPQEDSQKIARNLEESLLQGEIKIGGMKQINYPSFVYRPRGWNRDLQLMHVSSMVSELAPVVLYLRYLVRPGNTLIIEEPEAHLHPEMQAIFTRQLVAAVQSGIRILITTHSEWILEELANLVRLSELHVDRRVGIANSEIAISPDRLGIWFFEPGEGTGGSVVREISLDEESATFPAGYGLVADSLYNRWAEIVSRIQEE